MTIIGFQGEEGCYSYQVIKKYLAFTSKGFHSFEDIFINLINNNIDYALIPIENSTGGSILINYDLFVKYNITIIAEFKHNINHCLYCNKGCKDKVKYTLSHPQAIEQCKNNITKYNYSALQCWDTMGSINEMITKGNEYSCIAPCDIHNDKIEIINNCFNDNKQNITRFYLIKCNNIDKTINFELNDNVKFSCYLKLNNSIGVLGDYLLNFKNYNIDLTKIESRPLNTFEYTFFIEGVGNKDRVIQFKNFVFID